jgi:hypothetical protein
LHIRLPQANGIRHPFFIGALRNAPLSQASRVVLFA